MLRSAVQDSLAVDWEQSRAVSSLPCIVAVAICLAVGTAVNHPAAGMVAASGAMSVGFGSFQRLGRSRFAPMLWATIGMAVCTASGSLAAHSLLGLMLNDAALGLIYGMMTAISGGSAWISLQCGIFGIIATGYPASPEAVLSRALLILGGGLLQLSLVSGFRRLHVGFSARVPADPFPGFRAAFASLGGNLESNTGAVRYAIWLAVALAISAVSAHLLTLSNEYWVPMTALLVLRTDLHQTLTRGLARMGGTIVGAGLATLLLGTFRPGPHILLVLVVIFVWLCYSVVMVSYGAFSASVTAYVACLLAFAGLPASDVAVHRIENTCTGGAIALVVAVIAQAAAPRNGARRGPNGSCE